MKTRVLPLVFPTLAAMLAVADPAGPPVPPVPTSSDVAPAAARNLQSAWLGIKISRPSPEVRAHLPSLPKGTGFVIEGVEAGGPATLSGLVANDVIWMMDDQLLVNEAQLAVLLSQHQPGQTVKIDYFRGGQQSVARLVLGEAPAENGFEIDRSQPPLVTAQAQPGTPMRIINVPSRTACIDNEDGRAELTMDRNGFQLVIADSVGRTTYEGPLFDNHGKIAVPAAWRERVESLHAALLESMERAQATRRPRLRVIPKALDAEADAPGE